MSGAPDDRTRAGATGGGPVKHGVSARRRVAGCGALGVLVGALSILVLPWQFAPLVGWDVAALAFVASTWLLAWNLDARQTGRYAEREDPTRAAADLLLLAAAVASLVAVGYVIVRAGSDGGMRAGLQVGFGVLSLVISWTVIHTVFTLKYAQLYYGGRDGGADFHQPEAPCFSDFGYLAFTVGMTFQVSDTEVNTSEFRRVILRHALLSYLFGTVIVALTINLVAGLGK